MKRNLSGVYFRHTSENGKFENIVFEELPENKQNDIMSEYNKDQLISLCKILANTIVEIGDITNLAVV